MGVKDGIVIKEYARFRHKLIYNRGFLMQKYIRIPKDIQFRSPMVNDLSQDLCGGWHPDWIEDENTAIIERVLAGLKPMGIFLAYSRAKAKEWRTLVDRSLFHFEMRYQADCKNWEIMVAKKGKLGAVFDLESLKRDYSAHVSATVADEIELYADRELCDFLNHWAGEDIPAWLIGLILGYPVENTISLYLEGFCVPHNSHSNSEATDAPDL